MSIEKTHVIFDFRSDLRTGGTEAKPIFHPYKAIHFHKQNTKEYYMRIQNISMPISFYQINSNYNTIIIRERNSGDITTIELTTTITEGNYTINELTAELATELNAISDQGNTYTVTYDEKTGKINIAYAGGASVNVDILSYDAGSTINPIIGAGEYASATEFQDIQSTGTDLPNHYNLGFIDKIFLTTNISSHNHMDDVSLRRVGAVIPITQPRGDRESLLNNDGYPVRVKMSALDSIHFSCRDPYKNLVDLNGVPFSGQIVFYERE